MRRRIGIGLGVMILVALFGGAWLWVQVRSAPKWYAPPDPTNERVARMAEEVEYGVVEGFHKLRPDDGTWTMRIDEHHLNAWLTARLPAWMAHEQDTEWPEALRAPQVHVVGDAIELAVEVTDGAQSQIVVSRLTPRVADARITLTVDSVGLGRLTMPSRATGTLVEWVEQAVPADLDDAALDQLLGVLESGQAMASMFELADGRRVEVVDLRLVDGAIELTNRTLPD